VSAGGILSATVPIALGIAFSVSGYK
jgi:hypothetical protein